MFALSLSRLHTLCTLKSEIDDSHQLLQAYALRIQNNTASDMEKRLFAIRRTLTQKLEMAYNEIAPKNKFQQLQLDRHIKSHK